MKPSPEHTLLWSKAFGSEANGAETLARQRLRQSWRDLRSLAATIASEIHAIMPEFTVHDVTHLDALWDVADLIASPDVTLNPPEAFIFGGAVLLYDLGMALAAYPNGIDDLRFDFSGERHRSFHSRTAVGAIVKGLSVGWSCHEDAIWDSAQFESDEENNKPTGTIGYAGREVIHVVAIFERPAMHAQRRSKLTR